MVGFPELAIASQSAKFVSAYTKIGLSPDGSSSFFMPRIIGIRRYYEMVLTNRTLSAEEACDWGLVSEVVDDDQLLSRAMELAQSIADGPQSSYRRIKSLVMTSFDSDQIKDGLHVRVALEQLALKQSIERLSDSEWRKHCEHLQDLVDQMLKAAEDFDAEKDAELDIDWHTAIIDASRNQNLSRTWRLTGLSHFIWSIEYRLYPLNQNDLFSHHERHQKLLDVFIEKNPEKCAKELQHHILRKIQDIDF